MTTAESLMHLAGEKKKEAEIDRVKKRIESLEEKDLKPTNVSKEENDLAISIQILILHYLDILNSIKLPNTKKAILLSAIFGSKGTENIRKKLSNVGGKGSKLLNEENLLKICKLFEETGEKDALKKAQSDLEKAKKKDNH